MHNKVKIVGIGGYGSKFLRDLIRKDIIGADFIAVVEKEDIDLKGKATVIKVHDLLSLSTQDESILLSQITEAETVFIVLGLGGFSQKIAPEVLGMMRRLELHTVGFMVKPFTFEGISKRQRALDDLPVIVDDLDVSIIIENDKLHEWVTRNQSCMLEAFNVLNDHFIQLVQLEVHKVQTNHPLQ